MNLKSKNLLIILTRRSRMEEGFGWATCTNTFLPKIRKKSRKAM